MPTAEEQQKLVERLVLPVREPKELPPLQKTSRITNEQLQSRIKFLYDDSIAHKQQQREERERKIEEDRAKESITAKKSTISGDEEISLVSRLYDDSIERKEKNWQELYNNEVRQYTRTTKTISPSVEKEFVNRLYTEGMEREREKHIKLYEQFVLNRREPSKRISQRAIQASADKLSQRWRISRGK